MSNLRLSAESSLFYQYNRNKVKKDLHPFVLPEHGSTASDQESDISGSGDDEPKDHFNEFSPEVSHANTQPKIQQMSFKGQENAAKVNNQEDQELQLKGSFTRKPVTRQTPVEKKKEVGTKSNSEFDFFQESESLSEKSDKRAKPPARNTEKTNAKNPPPGKKRGKKNAENLSTESGNAPEPAAKRPRVASKRKAISTAESATASTEHADKVDNISKRNLRGNNVSKVVDEVETESSARRSKRKPQNSADPITLRENKGRGRSKKAISAESVPGTSSSSPTESLDNHNSAEAETHEAKNDEANKMISKTAGKARERIYHFLSSSESEVEDEEDDEDDFILLSSNSFRKTKSPKSAVPLPSFKTPTTVTNKDSELVSPKTSKFRLLPEPEPLRQTPRRTLTLVKEISPNRVEQSTSGAENVADTGLYKRSEKKTQLKPSTSRAIEKSGEQETPVSKGSISDYSEKPSPTKQLQPRVKSSQQLNDPENDIYESEKSSEETPLSKRRNFSDSSKKPSPTKRLQSRVESSQQLNDPENDIYGNEKSSEETPLSKRRNFADSSKKPSPSKRLRSRVESSQQLNDPERDIYGNEKSSEETPVSKRRSFSDSSKKPSPTKRLQFRVKSSQQSNDSENDIYEDDSGLIEAVQKRTMLRSENSTNRQALLRSAIDPSTLPVPNRSPLRTKFNLYLASPGDPIRAQQLLSNAEYSISLVHLLPNIIFPLKINNPMLVMRLKGSVEFRSDPHAPSRILLNSSTRLVDLKEGRILHVVNTGEEVASFQLTEILK